MSLLTCALIGWVIGAILAWLIDPSTSQTSDADDFFPTPQQERELPRPWYHLILRWLP